MICLLQKKKKTRQVYNLSRISIAYMPAPVIYCSMAIWYTSIRTAVDYSIGDVAVTDSDASSIRPLVWFITIDTKLSILFGMYHSYLPYRMPYTGMLNSI